MDCQNEPRGWFNWAERFQPIFGTNGRLRIIFPIRYYWGGWMRMPLIPSTSAARISGFFFLPHNSRMLCHRDFLLLPLTVISWVFRNPLENDDWLFSSYAPRMGLDDLVVLQNPPPQTPVSMVLYASSTGCSHFGIRVKLSPLWTAAVQLCHHHSIVSLLNFWVH